MQIVCDFYLWWVGLLVYSEFSMALQIILLSNILEVCTHFLWFSCENKCVVLLYLGDHVLVVGLWVETACLLRYLQNFKDNILNTYMQHL